MWIVWSLRDLRRRPGGTALSVLIVALAVGAATVGAEIANRVVLNPLPYPDPDRLVMVWSSLAEMPRAPISGPELRDVREGVPGLAEVGAVWTTSAALLEGRQPEPIRIALVTGNLLPVLGARATLGRTLNASDGGHGSDPVLVLGGGLWQRRFGGDPTVLGRSLRVAGGWGFPGGRFTAVGVLPQDYRLALPAEAGLALEPDVWIAWPEDILDGTRDVYYLRALGRLAEGATLDGVQGQVEALDRRLVAEHAGYEGVSRGFFVMRLADEVTRGLRPVAATLLAGALVLLTIAAADVAALALARSVERRREMATRSALGASRGRILRMLLLEASAPVAVGGVVGTLLAGEAATALRAVAPAEVLAGSSPGLGVPALGAAAVMTLAAVLASALAALAGAPSLSGIELLAGVRAPVAPGGRLRRLLVVGQAALATALLVAAALTGRSFTALRAVDPGFRSEGALAFRVDLPPGRYPGPAEVAAFERELEGRLGSLPGVLAVGATSHLPFDTLPNWTSGCRWPGDERVGTAFEADARAVSPGYARAAGLRVLRGRFLDGSDSSGGEPAIVVDEMLAERTPSGRDPLGAFLEVSLWAGRGRGFETVRARIVGVVAHARHADLTRPLRPQIYASLAQSGRNQLGVLVRAQGDPAALADALRAELAQVDPELALAGPRKLDDYLESARAPHRATALIASGFALASTLLAVAGVYGILAHIVSRRRREMGLRLALGAAPASLRRLVFGEGLRLTMAGLAVGLLTALASAHLVRGLLFRVSPADPTSFAVAALLVAAASVAAAWGPAIRAAAVDPLESLREE